jgi:ATP-binding cassette subfamily B protein
MQYHQQTGVNDCAPACLAMVASHYKSYVSIGEIRKLCKTDSMGTNLVGMIAAAEKLGFTARAFKGEKSDKTLDTRIIFPFIAQIKIEYLGNVFDHFVVIKRITKKNVEIWDPNPVENRHLVDRVDFLNIWTGYVLFLNPDIHFIPKKGKGNVLFKYAPLLLPHKKSLVLVCIASAVLILFGIVTSYYYKYIVDEVIITKAAFTLASLSIGVLLLTIVQSIIEAIRTVLINHFVFKSDLQLDFSYIAHVLKLPVSFFDSMRTGEILSRLIDISKIRNALSGTALSILMDIVLLIVVGPLLFSINSMLFLIDVVNVLFVSIIIFFFSKLYRKYYAKLRHEEAGVSSTLVELINGAYTIKALNAEQMSFNRYEESRMYAVWTGWKTSYIAIVQGLITGIINGVTGIMIFWIGSSGIILDTFSIGTLLSFNALAGYFVGPLFRLVNLQAGLQEAYVAAERVTEILEMEVEQTEGTILLKPSRIEGEIDFSHVCFRYGMRSPVYADLSLHIGRGQWAAFVGPSGCGKTTLVKLLLKFYQPEQGVLLVDGHDLRDIDSAALRDRIGYVPQEIYIFAGTIAENIALHNPTAPLEEVIAAAEKAGADNFINSLPERYNTRLSERGSTLSGGERQRLALARALLSKPDIMILDEATSSLDSVSERIIHQTIEKLRGSMTAIIIAHRLTTIRNCDIIFVMNKGNIIEEGNHVELLKKNGLYKALWEGTVI